MKPVYYASEVASLLGKNRFKPREESLYRVLSTLPRFKASIQLLKESTGALSEREIVEIVPEKIKRSVEKAVQAVITSTCDVDIKNTIDTFQRQTVVSLLNDAISGSPLTLEFKEAGNRILSNESTVEKEVKRLGLSPVVSTITGQIQKQRGTRMEEKAEDEHSVKTGVSVTNRNTGTRYEGLHYTIVGYIDGTHGDKVIETKNRKHFWGSPPEYDLIQLRCYMKMRGNLDGVLLERFPNEKTRETHLPWDDSEWSEIDTKLIELSTEIENMTEDDVWSIVNSVLTKTDKKLK